MVLLALFVVQVERKRFLIEHRDIDSPTNFSIVKGGDPMCYASLTAVVDASTTLLSSVAGTPKARSHPYANRMPRIGITQSELLNCCVIFFHLLCMFVPIMQGWFQRVEDCTTNLIVWRNFCMD